ncbi:hypothetical protein AURDEDRAFT_168490 [Auricularia subglabra TFB-10046 SS5]|nr:hypothetical protein AURDEDRAFT_168490 [Auricularia subglabra TFB-10046 SS5]
MCLADEDFDITFEDIERRAAESGGSVCDEDGKPCAAIPDLIRCAINGSEHKKLCYYEIVEVLEERFPRWGDTRGWRSTVRHTLTHRNDFAKVRRPAGYRGRGFWWKIDPTYAERGLPLRKQSSRRKSSKACDPKKGKGKGNSPSPSPASPSPASPSPSSPSPSPSPPPPSSPSPGRDESLKPVGTVSAPAPPTRGLAAVYAQPAYAHPPTGWFGQPYAGYGYGAYGQPPPPWAASRPPGDIGAYASGYRAMLGMYESRSRSGSASSQSASSSSSAYQGHQHRPAAPMMLPPRIDPGIHRGNAHFGAQPGGYAPAVVHPGGYAPTVVRPDGYAITAAHPRGYAPAAAHPGVHAPAASTPGSHAITAAHPRGYAPAAHPGVYAPAAATPGGSVSTPAHPGAHDFDMAMRQLSLQGPVESTRGRSGSTSSHASSSSPSRKGGLSIAELVD